MKRNFLISLAMFFLWGAGSFLWLDAYLRSAEKSGYEQQFFGTGTVVLFVITAIFLYKTIKYHKYWKEEGKYPYC